MAVEFGAEVFKGRSLDKIDLGLESEFEIDGLFIMKSR